MAELEQLEANTDSIGARLRSAREAHGLSLDEIAAKTRVPIRHLLHIEKGEWNQLPAPTYSIGFARAYASAVGLDASEVGAQLRQQISGPQTPTPSYYEPADPARVPPKWVALIAGLVAILLIGGYFVWRSQSLGEADAPLVQEEAAAPATQAGPANAPSAAPPPATGPVVLTATGDVWIRVYEADGPRLHEGILKAGERYEVPATATRPQLITGRPNVLQVTVGSTPIPPLGPAERTISDVSLSPADLVARTAAPAQPAASTGATNSSSTTSPQR